MSSLELKTAASVAFIFFCRMMGLFMVLPVMSLYGMELQGATLTLLGLALGIYGLSQAFLQIPFALLSDFFGRKRIILLGLLLFFLGSLGASFAENIWALIFFRFLQGAGAIAGTSMALLSDASSESSRAKLMALVGIAIGISFILALVAGPLLASINGLQSVFLFSSVLALAALLVAAFVLKEPSVRKNNYEGWRALFTKVAQLTRHPVLRLYSFSIFALHLVMTSGFLVIPIILEKHYAFPREEHWWIFLSVFIVALVLMAPFAKPSGEVQRLTKLYGFCVLSMSFVLLALAILFESKYIFFPLLCVFFALFNLIEALLPSMLSIEVSESNRAGAMGIFSSAQFLGAFFGGVLAGLVLDNFDIAYVFVLCGTLFCCLSLLFVLSGLSARTESQRQAELM